MTGFAVQDEGSGRPSTRDDKGALMAAVKPIPDNYPRVTAYLAIDGAGDAIDFYKKIFGAEERFRMPGPDGRIGHAEIQIGDSVIMMADASPDMDFNDPKKLGGTPVTLTVYVEDVDKTFKNALKAGAKETQPVEDKFYGDRAGAFDDPWGHRWNVMSHVEDVSPEEMNKRMAAFTAGEG
jgi:PhnB protein